MDKREKKHLYEGMYILSATLSDDARQKALDKITALIEKNQGSVHRSFEQGRRKLAYPINDKREGYYFVLYFTCTAAKMQEMWREYHLNEDLIRFITMRTESVPEKLEFKSVVQEA